MKIIHTADWHLGKIVNDYAMLEDQLYIIRQLIQKTKELLPDLFIIAGDLYDRSQPSSETIQIASMLLKELRAAVTCPIIIIRGNHDSGQRISYLDSLLTSQGIFFYGAPKAEVIYLDVEGARIFPLPFIEIGQARLNLENDNIHSFNELYRYQLTALQDFLAQDKLNIGIAHGSFASANQEEIERSESERPLAIGNLEYTDSKVFKELDYVALGHYHMGQKVGSERVRYSGSPLKYSKSEARHQKKFLEINLDKSHFEVIEHPLIAMRDLEVIRGKFSDLMARPNDNYVFIELDDEDRILDVMNRLKVAYPNIMGLEYTNHKKEIQMTERQIEDLTIEKADALFANYFNDIKGKPLDTWQAEYVSEILNHALEVES